MISKVLRIVYFVILAALVGCAGLAPLLSQPTPASIPQAAATPQPLPTVTQTALPATEARVLRVWLPLRFDPNADTESAKLLKQRLIDFQSTHPGLEIDIRVKTEVGETSLFNSLSLTRLAAPSALPDLIALSRPDLEAAILKGLLHPIDGLSTVLDDPNWYPYARELGHIQNIGYGLPFAGNALVLVHRPGLELNTWDDLLASKEVLVFPAGDPQALVGLSLYISAGGKLVNEQGLPTLEAEPLTEVLALVQNSAQAQILLPALVNYETGAQAMQAYRDERATLAIAWAADGRNNSDTIQLVPSLNGTPHTFATGWIWALAGSDPENQQAATELAEYLIANDFLGNWLENSGYLPTRLSQASETDVVLEAAHVLPSNDVLLVLGPIMDQALSRVLNGDQIESVVRSAMEQIK